MYDIFLSFILVSKTILKVNHNKISNFYEFHLRHPYYNEIIYLISALSFFFFEFKHWILLFYLAISKYVFSSLMCKSFSCCSWLQSSWVIFGLLSKFLLPNYVLLCLSMQHYFTYMMMIFGWALSMTLLMQESPYASENWIITQATKNYQREHQRYTSGKILMLLNIYLLFYFLKFAASLCVIRDGHGFLSFNFWENMVVTKVGIFHPVWSFGQIVEEILW